MGFGRNNLKKRIILSHSIRGSWLVVMGKESVAVQVAPFTWHMSAWWWTVTQQGREHKEFRLELEFATHFKGAPPVTHFL